MNYWLDLFTGTTWKEFRTAGSRVSGFKHRMRKTGTEIKSGDILICYMTGVMRWVGALEVVGPSKDKTKIWTFDEFPVRFDVKPVIELEPEHGVPMIQLEGKVSWYRGPADRGKFRRALRKKLQ